jgi:hypothetical protein
MFYNIDQTTTPCVLQYTYCTLLYYLYSTVSPPTPTPTEHQQQQADSVTTITTSTIPLIAALHCMSLHPGVKLRHQVIHLNIVYVYVTVCMQGKQHALDHHTFDTHIVTTHNCGCPLPSFGGGAPPPEWRCVLYLSRLPSLSILVKYFIYSKFQITMLKFHVERRASMLKTDRGAHGHVIGVRRRCRI